VGLTVAAAKDRIRARIIELANDPESGWVAVPGPYGLTIRYTRTHPTPDYHRGTRGGRWDQDTYDDHVFVTLAGRKVLLGVAPAPWVGRQDSDCPLWLAEAILTDPTLAHDTQRVLDMRRARRSARRTP
jgi:hypothetical protein